MKVVFCPFCASATVCCLLFSTSVCWKPCTFPNDTCSAAWLGKDVTLENCLLWSKDCDNSCVFLPNRVSSSHDPFLGTYHAVQEILVPLFLLTKRRCMPSAQPESTHCILLPDCKVVVSIKFLSLFECICSKEDPQLDNKAPSWERTDRCPPHWFHSYKQMRQQGGCLDMKKTGLQSSLQRRRMAKWDLGNWKFKKLKQRGTWLRIWKTGAICPGIQNWLDYVHLFYKESAWKGL